MNVETAMRYADPLIGGSATMGQLEKAARCLMRMEKSILHDTNRRAQFEAARKAIDKQIVDRRFQRARGSEIKKRRRAHS